MKKVLLLLLGVLLALPALARNFAYTYEGETLTYTVIDEDAKTCMTTRQFGELSENIVIPEKANDGTAGFTVVAIGENSFNHSNLKTVTIPGSVTEIRDYAFSSSNLTSVNIPASVTKIGVSAFDACNGLTSVTIPASVTEIGWYAFSGCYSLASVSILGSGVEIGLDAFNCWGGCLEKAEFASIEALCSMKFGSAESNPLTFAKHLYIDGSEVVDVVIPATVTEICNWAFYQFENMASVSIPNSVTKIGKYAFSGCGLTSILIPASVTEIGEWAFSGCGNTLVKAEFESIESLCSIKFIDALSNPLSCAKYLYIDGKEVVDAVIPETVTEIGNLAFCYYSNLKSVSIPNSVTRIGASSFSCCDGLTSVTIPANITEIGQRAFFGCEWLTSVYYGAENPILAPDDVFEEIPRTATLYVPESAIAKCKETEPWKGFANIVAYDFSGIDEVVAVFDANLPVEVYDLNGVKVGDTTDGLHPGIYIRKQGPNAEKLIVK
ncbi:MAG: leucine-rich repeat domain-containing protein [Duncaniella sp.]|nr:leucine-rich repeat domain-containing protein [Duncaniella sp.]